MRTPAHIQLARRSRQALSFSIHLRKISHAWLLAVALATPGFVTTVHAQSAPKPPVTFRILGLGAPVTDLFYYNGRQAVSVTAGSSGFSAPYPVPNDGRVEFFRVLPPEPPEEKPRRVTVTDLQLGEGGPFLVIMLTDPATPTQTRGVVVDDSWEKHPSGTMQLFSFSRRLLAVKVGDEMVELAAGQSRLFSYHGANRLSLQAATREGADWVLRIRSPKSILPDSRSTVVLIDQEPSPERPNPDGLRTLDFIDLEPPEPTP